MTMADNIATPRGATGHPEQSRHRLGPDPEAPGEFNAGTEGESTSSLLKRLMDGLSTLFRKEIALARSEISDAASAAKQGALAMASGGLVLFAGFIIVLLAIVYALAQVLSFWLSALIVGGVVMLIGFIMVQGGKKKLQPVSFKPERTVASLEKDKEAMQRRTT
jgi:uncharacterized membrane protein YqjE